jgi:Antitoxin VbhA
MIAEQEQIERRAVVQSALASQLIEGLKPDATVIEDAEKWARGEMTIAAAVANYKARVRHDMA